MSVVERALYAAGVTALYAAVAVAHTAAVAAPGWANHARSHGWLILSVCVVLGCAALLRVPSRAVACTAGVLAGGVLGNVLAWLSFDEGIPNPIVAEWDGYGIAFNAADVFTLVGIVSLGAALARFAIARET